MDTSRRKHIHASAAVVALGVAAMAGAAVPAAAGAGSMVIKMTQVGCQFIESENGVNHGFMPSRKADCERINKQTSAKRLREARVIKLKPGKYTFRVVNKNVPYKLGFWLRSEGYNRLNPLHKLTKVSVSGGGLTLGKSHDYAVDLKPGEYVYSCPLNTTPDYKLIVE